MLQIKNELHLYCLNYAEERIRSAEQAILSAQEASADDTKSSAGDKYETTREMMQQEISRNQTQLHEARKLKHALSAINPDKGHEIVQAGSVVLTSQGNFFIAISAGQVKIADRSYFAVSPISPMGRALMGSTKGATVMFNHKEFTILDVI
ncbi:GreA/GreB family elongation factor [Desertivirga xinjiangensis]|uniref:GreA/GreB family elongation factor n=1 Tax=Desertivirga xinjiangensis TaxID=539206 RepID=UPI00210D1C87|nr:GreA/GreB family elongation factor [Pedobacter xinjiangensis]